MKKILIALSLLLVAANANGFEKKGFLTTKDCAEKGAFADCSLDSFVCGKEGCSLKTDVAKVSKKLNFVLFVHDDGQYYNVDTSKFHMSEIDEGISRNEVTIIGEYDKRSNTIVIEEMKAPPPPKKSFFKGCL